MDDDQLLSPADIDRIASSIADGSAKPKDARLLLAELRRQTVSGQLSHRMQQYLFDCLTDYLSGKKVLLIDPSLGRVGPKSIAIKSLDVAFGVVRPTRGQPRIDPDIALEVAILVLKRRVAGATLEVAVEEVAQIRQARGLPLSSETQVQDCWGNSKLRVMVQLHVDRNKRNPPWTRDELIRLGKIFETTGTLFTPENSTNSAA